MLDLLSASKMRSEASRGQRCDYSISRKDKINGPRTRVYVFMR